MVTINLKSHWLAKFRVSILLSRGSAEETPPPLIQLSFTVIVKNDLPLLYYQIKYVHTQDPFFFLRLSDIMYV